MSSDWGPPGLETPTSHSGKVRLAAAAACLVVLIGVPWCRENVGSIDLMTGNRACGAAPSEIRVWSGTRVTPPPPGDGRSPEMDRAASRPDQQAVRRLLRHAAPFGRTVRTGGSRGPAHRCRRERRGAERASTRGRSIPRRRTAIRRSLNCCWPEARTSTREARVERRRCTPLHSGSGRSRTSKPASRSRGCSLQPAPT